MCSGKESEYCCLYVATLFSTLSKSFLRLPTSCVKNSVVSVARKVLVFTFSSKNKVTISLATLCAISALSYSKPTLNAMVAANSLLIPMQCEYYALEGISSLMNTLKNIQETVNPGLYLEGIVRTMYDDRNRLTKDVSEQLIRYFGDKVFRACVPRNIRVAEAPSHGLPVLNYDKSSRGSIAYVALANEMIKNEKSK